MELILTESLFELMGARIKVQSIFRIISLFLISVGMLQLHAEEAAPPQSAEPEQKMLKEAYIETNQNISDGIGEMAERIDIYLTGKKLTSGKNTSSVRIENEFYYREGGDTQNAFHFNVNLRLPNLEKKWALKFSSYDEKEENRRIDQRQFRTQPKEENYGASLVFFKQLGDIKTSFQPRLELKNPLEMSYVLTFESDAEVGKFNLDPRLELFARPEKGTGVFFGLPFSYLLSDIWSYTFAQEIEYQDNGNRFSHNSGLSFSQKITDISGFNYSVAAACDNRETYHLGQYGFAVSWQHMLIDKALSYSVAPTWDFMKSNHFHGVFGTRLELDFIF